MLADGCLRQAGSLNNAAHSHAVVSLVLEAWGPYRPHSNASSGFFQTLTLLMPLFSPPASMSSSGKVPTPSSESCKAVRSKDCLV
jgi:hypothetical protein